MKYRLFIIFIILSCPHLILNFYSIYNGNLDYNLEHYKRAQLRLKTDVCTNSELRVLTDADTFCIEAHALTLINPYIKTFLDTVSDSINSVVPTNYFDTTIYLKFVFKAALSIAIHNYLEVEKLLPLYHESVTKKTKSY